MYKISFNPIKHREKPQGKEVAKISNSLDVAELSYIDIANAVGECGCTFCPAVFNGSRKNANFKEQQLFALDFDTGISFNEIQIICNKYQLPLLFAYKTFSWSEEKEKFRIAFALDMPIKDGFTANMITNIFMRIFGDCDKACKDNARMFYGGKGLLYLSEKDVQFSFEMLTSTFNEFMCDTYGQKHYKDQIRSFFNSLGVYLKENGSLFIDKKGGKCTSPILYNKGGVQKSPDSCNISHKGRRKVIRNFDWEALYDNCKLFRYFFDGTEYYYYPELFHIALNLCNIDKGKNKFLEILESPQNAYYEAYHRRNWSANLNYIIKSDYLPQSCERCIYCDNCNHSNTMISTAKPCKSEIKLIEHKEYCSIDEAEKSLVDNFNKALFADNGIHIIKAQTGIGKTHLYIEHMKSNPKKPLLIAVPTHALKKEIYDKARNMGIDDIVYTPELPCFSGELMEEINHVYNIGAGKLSIENLTEIYNKMSPDDEDYNKLGSYLDDIQQVFHYKRNIITTHDRLLYLYPLHKVFNTHEIIVDEDILTSIIEINNVSNSDIEQVISNRLLLEISIDRMQKILSKKGFQNYNFNYLAGTEIKFESIGNFNNINTNVLDLPNAPVLYNDGKTTFFIKKKYIPCHKMIVMSATANAEVYRMMLSESVFEYKCKSAKYMGKIIQHTNYTYSRYSMSDEKVMKFIKDNISNDTIITFKAFERQFNSEYHFGNTIGINCLEGKNISVIGLPNINEIGYLLYGMLAGVNPDKNHMCSRKVQYNGYEFYMQTFEDSRLQLIQMWTIESLLEQAVGRARLLRNDCTVTVFSRFPIEQAEIIRE